MRTSELPRLAALLLALLLWGAASAVQACALSQTGGALGTVNSFRVKDGTAITGTGSFQFSCGPVVLSLLAGTPSLTATIQTPTTGLTLKNGAFSIPYQIWSNSGMSSAYTAGALVVSLNGATLLGLLNSSGASVPLYIATTPGANVPAGTYTDTLQVTWNYANICEGLVNIAGLCLGVLNNGSNVVRTLTVTLVVTNDCTITAPTVVFGSAPLVSGFPTVSQNLSLLCTRGMTYTVGMSAGHQPAGGRRRMASGTNRLAYDLYKGDNTVWGSTGTDRANGPAAADGISVQAIPYTARIYQDQATPPAGSYTDTVVVDVSF